MIEYDLSLNQKDLNILITSINHQRKISSKLNHSNYLNYKDYNDDLILRLLSNKQNDLHNELSKINEQNTYLQEATINSLQTRNFINNKSQIKLIKNLKKSKENLLDKISSINQQIYQIKENQKINLSLNENSKEEYSENLRKQFIFSNMSRKTNYKINLKKKLKDEEFNQQNKNDFKLVDKNNQNLNNNSIKTPLTKEMHKSFINKIIVPNRNSGYLYQKMTSSFDEKEQSYIKERLKNKNFDFQKNSKLEIKYNSLKRKITYLENLDNLHKIWKERSELLPKYVSSFYKNVVSTNENEKKEEKNKINQKKILYELKKKYGKEKINLPAISPLLKKDWDKKEFKFNIDKSKRYSNIINNNLNIKLIQLRKKRKDDILKENKSIDNIVVNETNSKNYNFIFRKNEKIKHFQSFININNKLNLNNNINSSDKSSSKINNIQQIKNNKFIKFKKQEDKKENENNIKYKIEAMEDKYKRGKELLKLKGGYVKNEDLGDEINQLLINSIKGKLDILEKN